MNTIDTNLYKEKNGDGFRLFMVTPPFPLNAGTFNDYLTTKANSFMKTYTGTLQEMADGYLTGGREGLRPMAYSFISHIKFDNRMYLTEQTIDDVIQFGFANDDDVSKASALWTFVPVDNDANYFGIVPEVEDANGNGYSTFVADFPIKLAEGMQAYYVTDEMDPANSQVKWQKVEDEKIPAKTPVIIQLKGKSAADNKVQLLDENYSYSLSDNALMPVANEMGFLLGRVLDEPDPNIYVLDVKDGKVCLASSSDNVLRANTAYLYVTAKQNTTATQNYTVQNTITCPNCGARNVSIYGSCWNCGYDVYSYVNGWTGTVYVPDYYSYYYYYDPDITVFDNGDVGVSEAPGSYTIYSGDGSSVTYDRDGAYHDFGDGTYAYETYDGNSFYYDDRGNWSGISANGEWEAYDAGSNIQAGGNSEGFWTIDNNYNLETYSNLYGWGYLDDDWSYYDFY